MLITPIFNTAGRPIAYTATVYHKGRFVGVFSNPTRLLVIKNAMLRIDIMEILGSKRMDGGIGGATVAVRCLC